MGVASKISDESRLCLLATIMDFPYLTDKERTNFLNKYGPNASNPAFSVKERNTFGYIIARYSCRTKELFLVLLMKQE